MRFANKFKETMERVTRGSVFDATATQVKPNARTMKELGGDAVAFVKKNYNPKDPFFVKDQEQGRNINNLWTGQKLGGKGNLLMTGSLLGGGAIIASDPRGYQNSYMTSNYAEMDSEAQDIESLQSTRSDQLGYQAQIGSKSSQTLSTSGDLVFAMHKTRHSGQF